MGTTKKLTAEWNLVIDPELKDFLPRDPLRVKSLESQIIEEGCRDAIIVWKGKNIIVDGYTRYDICSEHGIAFDVYYMDFANKADAMQWALNNQWSRRNLTVPERVEALRKIEAEIRAAAKERQGTRTDLGNIKENFPESEGQSRDKLGAMAGISGKTYEKASHIIDNAPEPIKEAWKRQNISTDTAFKATKMPEEEQKEVITAIEQGGNVKKEVNRVLRDRDKYKGWTKEDRENRAETLDIYSRMRCTQATPTYTVEMLIEEIEVNGANFLRMMQGIIHDHIDIVTEDNRTNVGRALENILNGLKEIGRNVA